MTKSKSTGITKLNAHASATVKPMRLIAIPSNKYAHRTKLNKNREVGISWGPRFRRQISQNGWINFEIVSNCIVRHAPNLQNCEKRSQKSFMRPLSSAINIILEWLQGAVRRRRWCHVQALQHSKRSFQKATQGLVSVFAHFCVACFSHAMLHHPITPRALN